MKPEVDYERIITAPTYADNMRILVDDPTERPHIYKLDIADKAYPQGLYFVATQSRVLQALYFLNRDFAIGGIETLNDLYRFLFLPETEYGETVAWSCEDYMIWLDWDIEESRMPDGRELLIIHPLFDPDEEWKIIYIIKRSIVLCHSEILQETRLQR